MLWLAGFESTFDFPEVCHELRDTQAMIFWQQDGAHEKDPRWFSREGVRLSGGCRARARSWRDGGMCC